MNNAMPELKRSLTLSLLTLYGLGNILGAGIYVLIGNVVATAGVFTPWSFLIASVIAGLFNRVLLRRTLFEIPAERRRCGLPAGGF